MNQELQYNYHNNTLYNPSVQRNNNSLHDPLTSTQISISKLTWPEGQSVRSSPNITLSSPIQTVVLEQTPQIEQLSSFILQKGETGETEEWYCNVKGVTVGISFQSPALPLENLWMKRNKLQETGFEHW